MRRLLLLSLLLALVVAPSAASAAQDPFADRQWGIEVVQARAAWKVTRGAGTVIAVVDSGVHLTHEDLKVNVVAGTNTVTGGSAQDDHGHGTHVAGIAGAVADNGLGVAGIAPKARIMPVKVFRTDPKTGDASGSVSDIAAGIRWAADHGADVINLSLGSEIVVTNLLPDAMTSAIAYAWDKGAVPVLAAGNDVLFPSGYSNVDAIVVGATDRDDRQASYSNDIGVAKWGMVAPGGEPDDGVISTYWTKANPDAYALAAGTSMAAPHVAGAAALLRSLGLSAQETVDTLLETAVALGPAFRFGAGRLDVRAAVAATGASVPDAARKATPRPVPGQGPRAGAATPPRAGAPVETTSPTPTTDPAGSGGDPFTIVGPDLTRDEAIPPSSAGSGGVGTAGVVAGIVFGVGGGLGAGYLFVRLGRRS